MRWNLLNCRGSEPPSGVARFPWRREYVPLRLERLEDRITPSLGAFELDGNATTQTTHDWDQVYNDAVTNPGQNTSGSISGAVLFRHDPVNSALDDTFTGGLSKDINDLNKWAVALGAPQAKADIADAFAVAYQVQVGAQTHTILNFGADRIDNSGNATMGFWFFQNPIRINANGTFTGAHAPGDILLVVDFSNSAATIDAYKWVGPGGSTDALQLLAPDPTNIFARVNTGNTPTGGWPFVDNGGTPANTFAPGEFVEGGIDLTALGLPTDLNNFLVETRSSNSLNATLSDLVLGTFDTFRPDLVVTKTDTVTSAAPGDTLTYTVTVTNVGDAIATGVVATDTLPANTIFVDASNGGTFANGVVTWNIAPLAPGASVTRTVRVRVNSTIPAGVTEITNEVSAVDDGANGPDPTPGNNTAVDTDTLVAAPDLTVTKTDLRETVRPGQTLTYILTISNTGGQDATGVVATDTLPANTTFVDASNGGTLAGGKVTWMIGNLAAGATVTRSVTVTVNNIIPAGVTDILNAAAVSDDSANGPDPTPGNNAALDTDKLDAAPDLTVTKTDNQTTVQPEQMLTYTLTITNVGNQGATGVIATDAIPDNTDFFEASNGGTFANGAVTWDIGDLDVGVSVTRTVTVKVGSNIPAGVDSITNVATVSDDGINGPDPTLANNAAFDTDTLVAAADLTITKDDTLTVVIPGQMFTYTLVVSNVGNQDASGVTVFDTLPENTTFVGASGGGVPSNGTVLWELGTLAAGATTVLTVTVTVNDPVPAGATLITNTAIVTSDAEDPTPANNFAFDTNTLDAAPDLVILKTDDRVSVQPGQTLTYTLTISNVGNQDATGVIVTDPIPANATFVSAPRGTFANGAVTFDIGGLAVGATVTRTVTVQVNGTVPAGVDSITNTATVDDGGVNGPDPTPENNTASDTDTTLVAAPDLTVTKDDGVFTAQPGERLTYTVTISNVGTQGATGVTATDTIPGNTAFVDASDGGSLSGDTVSWIIGDLAAGASVTRTVRVTVMNPLPAGVTSITNTATVDDDHANGLDPTPTNNTASDSDGVSGATDLVVTKDDGELTAQPGQTLIYTLTIRNVGTQDATGVTVTDTIPDNTTFVEAPDGTFANGVVTWIVGDLAAGATVTRTVTVLVDSTIPAGVDSITNSATASHDGADPTPGNNTAFDTDTLVASPDLIVTKDDGETLTQPGQTLTYTLTIRNVGSQGATGVRAGDAIPGNTTFVDAPDGIFADGAVTWLIGALAAGASVTRTVTVLVDSTIPAGVDSITNAAAVSDDGANGPDPTPGNNTAFDTDTLVAAPDLTITKDDGLLLVEPGQTVTYTLLVSNVGNQDATGVTVTDTLPPGTGFFLASRGRSAANGVVTWDIGTLAAGTSQTLTVTVTVPNPVPAGVTSITNTATVNDDGINGPDPTPENNTALDTDTLLASPDLIVTKDDGETTAHPGETLTYTLTIRNVGSQGATGVTASDTIPDNTTFVEAPGGTFDNGVVTWIVGDLAAGAIVTRTVRVLVDSTIPAGVDSITNVATVDDDRANGLDPTPGNNADTDTDTLDAAPDLVVTKTDLRETVQPGETLTYTLTMTNVGNQDATGVTASDAIPGNTTFVDATNDGTFADGTVTWLVGALAAGASVTRTVRVRINDTVPAGVDTLPNKAAVSDDGANGPDPTPENNTAFDTDTLLASPDLTITKDDGLLLVEPGQTVTYTLLVSNVGNQDATGVTVTDFLPTGTGFIVASRRRTLASGAVTWDIGTLAAGTSQTLTVTVTVANSVPAGVDSITNTAVVDDDRANGPDPTPGNNADDDTDAVVTSSISGFVYRDYAINGIRQPNGPNPETGIGGVTITLSGQGRTGPIRRTTRTAADGSYVFDGLTSGSFTITEIQPPSVFEAGQAGFYDGLDRLGTVSGIDRGSAGGVVSDDVLLLNIGIGENGVNYNFGENPPADPFGFVYADLNDNGIMDPGEPGIPGVAVTVSGIAFAGTPLEHPLTPAEVPGGQLTVFTDARGQWRFPVMPPGTYSLVESQPDGFFDGREHNGDPNGPPPSVGNDRFDNVVLNPFPIRGPFDFGELLPASIAGSVYVDRNRNGTRDGNEPGIPGVAVTLTGTDDRGHPVTQQLLTDANGDFLFTGLRPGGYTLTETQPAQYRQGINRVGSAGGAEVAPDTLGAIPLRPGVAAVGYLFGEVSPQPTPVPPLPPLPVPPVVPSKGDFIGSNLPLLDLGTEPNYQALGSVRPFGDAVYLATAAAGVVRVFDMTAGRERFRFTPFPGFMGSVTVATGDLTGDFIPDIVAAAGPGGGPHVKVFDGETGAEIRSFYAYDPAFGGGVSVAVGDVDGDGVADIVTGAGPGGGPHVKVFSGKDGTVVYSFYAYDPAFGGGVSVAAGDVDGDGVADIVTGAGPGGGPHVRAFSGTDLTELYSFYAYDPAFGGGVSVAAGDVDGDGVADIVTGAGPGGGPHVRAFRVPSPVPVIDFLAGAGDDRSGVRVTTKDLGGDGRAEVVTGTAFGRPSAVRFFDPSVGRQLDAFRAALDFWNGSVFVG